MIPLPGTGGTSGDLYVRRTKRKVKVNRDGEVTSVVPGEAEQEVEVRVNAKAPIYAGVGALVLGLFGLGAWTTWNGVKVKTPLGDYTVGGLRNSKEFNDWWWEHVGKVGKKSFPANTALMQARCKAMGGALVDDGKGGWTCELP